MATSEHVRNEYLDEDGLAERYLIPPRTAQRWRADGGGPPFVRLGKRRVAYRVSDVEVWLAARTFKSRADELAQQPAYSATHPVPVSPTTGAEIAAQDQQRKPPADRRSAPVSSQRGSHAAAPRRLAESRT